MNGRVAFHVPCGNEMSVLPGGFYLRCVACDTSPLANCVSAEVELRKAERKEALQVSQPPMGVSHPASDVWPR